MEKSPQIDSFRSCQESTLTITELKSNFLLLKYDCIVDADCIDKFKKIYLIFKLMDKDMEKQKYPKDIKMNIGKII